MAIVQITAITLAIQYFYQVLPKQLKTKKTARFQSIAAGIFPYVFFVIQPRNMKISFTIEKKTNDLNLI